MNALRGRAMNALPDETRIDTGPRVEASAIDPRAVAVDLATTYDALRAKGRRALATGRVDVEPLPAAGTTRWGISAVLRPRPWPGPLADCARACATLIGGAGVVYGEDNLHITLRAIEGFRVDVADDDAEVAAYRDVLADLAARTAPIRLRLRGLAATPGGVLVQGWPAVDLPAFRRALYDRLAAGGLGSRGPETTVDTLRTTAHATLAIFEGPIAQAVALSRLVDAHGATEFGEWLFGDVWLVGYRRAPGRVELIEYGRFAFGGGARVEASGREAGR